MLKSFPQPPRRFWWAVPAIVVIAVLAHAVLAEEQKAPPLFPELSVEEIRLVNIHIDKHCQRDAESWGSWLADYTGVRDKDDKVSSLQRAVFRICQEAATIAAIQYGRAVGAARNRER